MKKLAFMFVAFAAISLASCNGNQKPAEATNDSDSVAVDSLDSTSVDSVVADTVVAAPEAE